MTSSIHKFDPYHKWFGIPAHEQPPNHYRLLRIAVFESDPEVIENAYDKEMADLKAEEHGEQAEYVDQLSRELVAAHNCLLSAEKKAAYDAELRKRVETDEDGNELADELGQRIATDQAVHQATANMSAERNRLRALANELSVREKNALLALQQLQQQWATASWDLDPLAPGFGQPQYTLQSPFRVQQKRKWFLPVVIASAATAIVLVIGGVFAIVALNNGSNPSPEGETADAADKNEDVGPTIDPGTTDEPIERPDTVATAQAAPIKGVLDLPPNLDLANISSEVGRLQIEVKAGDLQQPNRILRLSRISDAPEHINLFRNAVKSDQVAVRYYGALALLNRREDIEVMLPIVTDCLKEDSSKRQDGTTPFISQLSESDAIEIFEAYGSDLTSNWLGLLGKDDSFVQQFALQRLSDLGSAARVAVPALTRIAEDESNVIEFRRSVVSTIKSIDPNADVAIAVPVTGDPQVDQMIHRAVLFLGKAPPHKQLGGDCLIGLALYMAGQDASHSRIESAFARCQKELADSRAISRWNEHYNPAIAAIFLCNARPVQGRKLIENLVAHILKTQGANGAWTYTSQPEGDTSQTQWCIFALWYADKIGCEVPDQSMQRAQQWLLRTQDPSGSWGYMGKDPGSYNRIAQSDTRLSLTLAAMGSLLVSADMLGIDITKAASDAPRRVRGKTTSTLFRAVADSERWFSKNYMIDPDRWPFYYMNALERYYSFRSTVKEVNDEIPQFYRDGVQFLTRMQQRDGSWVSKSGGIVASDSTAFAVLFLTRSTQKMIEGAAPTLPTSPESPLTDDGKLSAKTALAGRRAGEERDDNSLKMKFCWCPPGKFTMGSPTKEPGRRNDEDQVAVTLTRGFWLGKHEVTQDQWVQVMRTTPWSDQMYVKEGADYSASFVNWNDAMEFCRKLTEQERRAGHLSADRQYTLPTEAEWEYACRAGSTTPFSFGGNESQLGEFAWFKENTWDAGERYAHQVGVKKPNAWGLHDMHGNVWEWCRDWSMAELPGGTDPEVTSGGSNRMFRGGSWNYAAEVCRSAYRSRLTPSSRVHALGFRVALVPSSK